MICMRACHHEAYLQNAVLSEAQATIGRLKGQITAHTHALAALEDREATPTGKASLKSPYLQRIRCVCAYACMLGCMCGCMYARMRTFMRMCVSMQICSMCVCGWMDGWMDACMHALTYLKHTVCVFIYVYTYSHSLLLCLPPFPLNTA